MLSSIKMGIINHLSRLSRVTTRVHLSSRTLHAPPPLAFYKRICQKLLLNECCVIVDDVVDVVVAADRSSQIVGVDVTLNCLARVRCDDADCDSKSDAIHN